MSEHTVCLDPIVKNLIDSGALSEEAAILIHNAGYKCEYCGLPFFDSPLNYKQFQVDHIVPRKKGGGENIENKAAACRTCNADFKISLGSANCRWRECYSRRTC
jgi:5-methylcytosine-specific restriction endonuclease McrA